MPESVKISELPPLSTVQPNDIVPVVDEFLTQTSRATASQIAAIGGGPPGANTVSTDKIQDNAVTAAKCAFTGPDKLFSRIESGPGRGVEIVCTPYARGLLASLDGPSARAYLDALQTTNSPAFTGQVKFDRGTKSAPSIVCVNDVGTGMFFPTDGTVSIANGGNELFRVQPDGTFMAATRGVSSILRPMYSVWAWVVFDGTAIAGASYDITANQHAVAARYGLAGTIADNAATRARLQAIEQARGINQSTMFPLTPTFNDSYGKGTNLPRYNLGTETRANYTTPGDNKHWSWNSSTSQWEQISANGVFWIGTLRLSSVDPGGGVQDAGGVASVQRTGLGLYTINLTQALPDADYAISAVCTGNGGALGGIRVVGTSGGSFSIAVQQTSNNDYYDPTRVRLAIIR